MPPPAENLQTTAIECRKARLQCVESMAVVSVNEQGFLDSIPAVFGVECWTDDEIVTKPEKGRCTMRTLRLDSGAKPRADAPDRMR